MKIELIKKTNDIIIKYIIILTTTFSIDKGTINNIAIIIKAISNFLICIFNL